MSNFIRQLLQRTFAPAATIHPRLASRFESGPAPARFAEERIETSAAPLSAEPPRPNTSASFPIAAPRAECFSPVAQSPPLTVPGPAVPSAALAPSSAQPAVPHSLVPAVAAPVAPPAPPAPVSTLTTASARGNFSLPSPSPGTLLVERVTERIRESVPAPITPVASSILAPVVQPIASTIAPAAPAPITAPTFSATPRAALSVATPAAPTVRVTIGRVDIRAIHTEPAAPVAPVAPLRAPAPERRPLVSLEAYLSQRDAK